MQAIILAAGMGNRLGKYTRDNTKCMLDINGKKLIHRALDALESNGISRCVIVVGYKKENLVAEVGSRHGSMEIEYVSNDVYHRTNNIYSLYLAKDWLLSDDTLLLESDLIFEPSIITELIASDEPTLAVVAKYESWMDGTVVRVSPDNVITQFIPKKSFDYGEKGSYFKTVNIYKFSRDFSATSYVPFLEAYSKTMGNNEYYEQVLKVIASLEKNELKALCVTGKKWYEIDDVQDKDIAEVIFAETPADKLRGMSRRFGGYWRFPGMLDFCYLVNPYFPPEQMLNEMKAYFRDLIGDYPSGLSVQNLLAGKNFGIDESRILAGNGAAELIRALSRALRGSVGVIYPTFNEYAESLSSNEIVEFRSDTPAYGLRELLDWSARCDNLILINPDNPSGNFIPRADVIALLESMRGRGKRLVLDESFIDFCSDGPSCAVLSQEMIDAYPNLIVVKSVSKSYGVPGIRLGVLACSDRSVINDVRGGLSIWNVNSFGEYFLQIAGKYKADYREACAKIVAERERFAAALSAIPYLRVYPSQANYFLCELTGGVTATGLAEYLLWERDIFIKDLTGKKGLSGNGWIRLAVRNSEDNDALVRSLASYPVNETLPVR